MEPDSKFDSERPPVSRWRRARALIMVIVIAFGWPLLNSTLIFIFVSGSQADPAANAPAQSRLWDVLAIVYMLACLALLVWILRRQGRTLHDIGLGFSWKDIPWSLLLFLMSYAALYATTLLMSHGYFFATGRVLDLEAQNIELLGLSISFVIILIMLINPFFEELLARAYLMTEVEFLSGSQILAVIVSAGLQASYHLYQGFTSMLLIFVVFMVFSIYFARRKRILPVILAHMYLDLIALFVYA